MIINRCSSSSSVLYAMFEIVLSYPSNFKIVALKRTWQNAAKRTLSNQNQ